MLTPALTIAAAASPATATPGRHGHLHDHGHQHRPDPLHRRHRHRPAVRACWTTPPTTTTPPPPPASSASPAPTLTWTGDLTPGAAATITYTVTVNNPDTGDHTLTNTVTSATAGSNCPAGSHRPPLHRHRRPSSALATLTFTQSTAAGTTAPGAVVHYTVTVANTGQTPYTGATFTDPLTGVLDDATYNGDAAATAGTVALSPART